MPCEQPHPVTVSLVEGHVALHDGIGREIESRHVRESALKSAEKRRSDASTLIRGVDGKRSDGAYPAFDDAANRPDDLRVVPGNQCGLVPHVLDYGVELFGKRRDVRASASATFFREGASLQIQHGGSVVQISAADGVHVWTSMSMSETKALLELEHRNAHRLALLLESGYLKCKSVFELALGNRESETEKSLFAVRQFVPLLIRLKLRGKNRTIAPTEHNRVIDVRGRVSFSRYQENGERRRERPVAMIRPQLDTDAGPVVLAGRKAQETNSRDLNGDALADEDVAIRIGEYAEFVDAAPF